MGPVLLVDVICDTSFLIQITTKKIKNIHNLDTEIGPIKFVVPNVVITELNRLRNNVKKHSAAIRALNFTKTLDIINLENHDHVDNVLFLNAKYNNRIIIATLDTALKKRIKDIGGSIISLANDRIIIE